MRETQRERERSLTIVIPVYNGRRHLRETIQSALNQSIPPREILVIEDGSPDPSADIAAEFPQVQYIVQRNGGVSSARNHGVAVSTADWICFLDQDDILLPQHLEQFLFEIEKANDADLFYTPRLLLTEADGEWTTRSANEPPPDASTLPRILLERCPFPPSGTCVRRTVFLAAGGFHSRYDLAEDWELWLRLTARGNRFYRCALPTVCYRVHRESNSHRPLPILQANLRVVRECVLPMMTRAQRVCMARRLISVQEGDAGILLRHMGHHGGTGLLLRSLLRFPFGNWRRYKIAAHMLTVAFRSRFGRSEEAI